MPETPTGRISEATLGRRIGAAHRAGVPPALAEVDLEIARLRTGESTAWYAQDAHEQLVDVSALRQVRTAGAAYFWAVQSHSGTAVDPGFRLTADIDFDWTRNASTWASLWPVRPDNGVWFALPTLLRDLEHDPATMLPSLIAAMCRMYVETDIDAGIGTHALVALGFASRGALNRAAALDLARGLCAQRRFDVVTFNHVSEVMLASGILKPSRLVEAFAERADHNPVIARDITLGLLSTLLTARHRHAHHAATLAVELVVRQPVDKLPDGVHQAAAGAGRSKLVSECRRLVGIAEHRA